MFPKHFVELLIMVESVVYSQSYHFIGAPDDSNMYLEHDCF